MLQLETWRRAWLASVAAAVAVAAAGFSRFEASAQQAVLIPARNGASDPLEAPAENTSRLRREGSNVEFSGVFRVAGDRVIFHPHQGGDTLRVLENLSLERIVGVLEESSRERQWKVRGVVTEYRGANYLLVKRAMIDSGRREEDAAQTP